MLLVLIYLQFRLGRLWNQTSRRFERTWNLYRLQIELLIEITPVHEINQPARNIYFLYLFSIFFIVIIFFIYVQRIHGNH